MNDSEAQGRSRGRARSRWVRGAVFLAALVAAIVTLQLGKAGSGTRPDSKPATGSGAPLRARAVRVTPRPLDVSIRGTGEVRHRDAVDLVSEVERRLVRIHTREGQTVKKGQVLFELDASDITARMRSLEVQLDFAKRSFERLDKVVGSGAASRTEWDTARARADELEAELRVESVNLEKTRVRAPFGGTLGLVHVSEGALVNPSVRLASLFDTEHLEIDFRLPSRFSSEIVPGLAIVAHVEGDTGPREGKILAVEPRIEAETQSVLARGVLDASGGPRAGSFARVDVRLREKSALLVPSGAIVPGSEGRQVFTAVDGRAVATPVELGERTVTEVEIVAGLSPGDVVLTSNLLRIRAGTQVEVELEAEVLAK